MHPLGFYHLREMKTFDGLCYVCVCARVLSLFSHVRLCTTPWAVAHHAPLVHGISQARILEWVAISFSRGSFQPTDLNLCTLRWQADSTSEPPGKPLS